MTFQTKAWIDRVVKSKQTKFLEYSDLPKTAKTAKMMHLGQVLLMFHHELVLLLHRLQLVKALNGLSYDEIDVDEGYRSLTPPLVRLQAEKSIKQCFSAVDRDGPFDKPSDDIKELDLS